MAPKNQIETDNYHPDPKAASTLHSSDAELENIVAKTEVVDEERPTHQPTKATKSADIKREKCSKAPKVALLFLCVLLIVILAVGLTLRSQPSTAMLDAITNFIKSDRLAMVGSIHIEPDYDEEFYNERYQRDLPAPAKTLDISFESKLEGYENGTTGFANIVTANDNEYRIDFSSIHTKDGATYLQTKGVKEAYAGLELPLIIKYSVRSYTDTINMLDNAWWNFDASEIWGAERAKAHQCTVDLLNHASDYSSEIAQVYQDHQFLNFERYSGQTVSSQAGSLLYQANVDSAALDEFVNAFFASAFGQNLTQCFSPLNMKPANIVKSIIHYITRFTDAETKLVFGVSSLVHQINSVYLVTTQDDTTSVPLQITFSYPSTVNIGTPAESTSAKPLVEQYELNAANQQYTYFHIDYGAE